MIEVAPMNLHEAMKQISPDMVREQMAVNEAIGALKYGQFNEKAAEVEARVRAEFRAKLKQEKENQARSTTSE